MIHKKINLVTVFNFRKNFQSLWVQPRQDRFAIIDGLRALSILWVISFHVIYFAGTTKPELVGLFNRPEFFGARKGTFGVDVFFTISGFLIAWLLFSEYKTNNCLNIKQFYFRRVFRILPAYFFVLAIIAIGDPNNIENIGFNIIYLNNFLPGYQQFMPWSWSLAIEEQFYTVFPLLLLVLFRFPKRVLWILSALLVLAFAIRYQVIYTNYLFELYEPYQSSWRNYDLIYVKPHTRYGGILIGVIVAYLVVYTPAIERLDRRKWLGRLMVLICIMGVVSYLFFTPGTGILKVSHGLALLLAAYRYFFNLFIAGIILYCFTTEGKLSWISKVLSAKFWFPFAQLSYSAYLIHPIIVLISIGFFYREGIPGRMEMGAIMLGLIFIVFLTAIMIFLLVEKPFMNIRSYFSTRQI